MKRKPIKEKYMTAICSVFSKEMSSLRRDHSINVIEFERIMDKMYKDFIHIMDTIKNDK